MADEVINVGLIGYGFSGRAFHAPVIQAVPRLKLKKVVERHRNDSAQRYPWVEVVRHHRDILNDNEIGLVIVATPNGSHFELARDAICAGKHVVVDKPIAITSNEVRQLMVLATEKKVIVSIYQNRRWDGDFLTVQRLVNENLLGEYHIMGILENIKNPNGVAASSILPGRLVDYEAHFDRFRAFQRPNAWREAEDEPGSGVLYDLGSHLIDQALVLFGIPDMVTGDVRRQRDKARTDDNFELIMHYKDGLKVTLKASMLAMVPGPRFILHGTKGSFIKSGMDPQEKPSNWAEICKGSEWGQEPKSQYGHLVCKIAGLEVDGHVTSLPGCYQAFYENVADNIQGRAELAVKPEHALNTIRIIELALESSAQRRSLPFAL